MYGYDDFGMNGWMWVCSGALIIGVLVLIAGLVVAVRARHSPAPGPTPVVARQTPAK